MDIKNLGSDRDPSGSVFLSDGKILRGIRPDFSRDYLNIYNQPDVQKMLGSKIVGTQIIPDNLPGYSLTFLHDLIQPPAYCYEWPLQMLQDAALLTLDICLELNQTGLVLKDATPYNILFDGARPLLVDFTSIMPQETDMLWVAYDQFFRMFMFPLLTGQVLSGRASRALLLDSGNGIAPEEALRLLPAFTWTRFPWLVNRLYLPMATVNLMRKSGQDKEISKYRQNIPVGSAARQAFFAGLKKDVKTMQFSTNKSHWSRYYADFNAFFDPPNFNAKQKCVADLLARCQPKTVVDIGCNQGGYAILAAKAGANVVAFDTDEDSVALLYNLVREKNLKVLPLVGDVLYPSPRSGWRGIEFESGPTRFRSQMALALALVHHLAITQNQTFDRIVKTLSDYSSSWLVTEFVPIEDPRSQELLVTNKRDMGWYTLDGFIQALKQEFAIVETYPSYPDKRILCFCQK